MHESSLLWSLLNKVTESADGSRVTSIRIAVGPGSHATAEYIAGAFPIFAHGSVADQARLVFEEPSVGDDSKEVRLISIEVD